MPRIGLLAAATVAAWLALPVSPGAATMAPQVLASEPEQGAELHQAPQEVSITFDLPLDPSESDLVVVDECGRTIDDGDPTVTGNQISVGIAETPSGRYSMVYRAVPPAGATGSSSGKIDFTVHQGLSCGPEAEAHHHDDGDGHEGDAHEGDAHDGHADDGAGHDGHEEHGSVEGHGADHGLHGIHEGNHDSASGASHGAHGPSKQRGNFSDEPGPTAAGSDRGPRVPEIEPGVVLAALLLCALFGLMGGYFVLGSRS